MPRSGTTILVQIENPASPGTYRTIGSQRDVSRDRNADFIDFSSKASYDQTGIGGQRSSSVTLDALFVEDDAAFVDLETAYETDPPLAVVLNMTKDGSNWERATAYVTSIGERHPHNDGSVVSVTFQVSGGWTSI